MIGRLLEVKQKLPAHFVSASNSILRALLQCQIACELDLRGDALHRAQRSDHSPLGMVFLSFTSTPNGAGPLSKLVCEYLRLHEIEASLSESIPSHPILRWLQHKTILIHDAKATRTAYAASDDANDVVSVATFAMVPRMVWSSIISSYNKLRPGSVFMRTF